MQTFEKFHLPQGDATQRVEKFPKFSLLCNLQCTMTKALTFENFHLPQGDATAASEEILKIKLATHCTIYKKKLQL